jgi:Zn-dependent protease with chaperone function
MTQVDLDFAAYIRQRKGTEQSREHGGAVYAYPGDQKVLSTLGKITPVKLAVEATVRLWQNVAKGQLLGSSVKVTERQFAEIQQITVDCARRLQIAVPTVYIAPEVGDLNAHTLGTTDDAYIVLNGVLVDHLEPDELRFVIGHECGHIQNNHVVYTTALYYLMFSANVFVRWIVQPAVLALQSWARRAEITCDRAGLLCCGETKLAEQALVKLALGSQKLAHRVDVEEYLKQLEESQQGVGRMLELTQAHPYLPKRVAALRYFAQTHYYQKALQAPGTQTMADAAADGASRSLDWCDAEVRRLLRIFGKGRKSKVTGAQAAQPPGAASGSAPGNANDPAQTPRPGHGEQE